MARRPEKKRERVAEAVEDRGPLTDETGDYEVIGRPYTTAAAKTANVRVKKVGSEVTMVLVWGAHERVARRGERGRDLGPAVLQRLATRGALQS
jgi:hypothetical protein